MCNPAELLTDRTSLLYFMHLCYTHDVICQALNAAFNFINDMTKYNKTFLVCLFIHQGVLGLQKVELAIN